MSGLAAPLGDRTSRIFAWWGQAGELTSSELLDLFRGVLRRLSESELNTFLAHDPAVVSFLEEVVAETFVARPIPSPGRTPQATDPAHSCQHGSPPAGTSRARIRGRAPSRSDCLGAPGRYRQIPYSATGRSGPARQALGFHDTAHRCRRRLPDADRPCVRATGCPSYHPAV